MLFDSLKLYCNPKGIPKTKLKLLLKRFVDNGGQLVELSDSNVILSLEPVESLHGIIIEPDFISDSILKDQLLPLPKPRVVYDEVKHETKRLKAKEPVKVVESENKSTHVCLKSSPLESKVAYNQLIIDELEKLLERYLAQGDRWRIFSYRKAIRAIKSYQKPIHSGEEAYLLPGIGQKIADKISEIIATGRLSKNDMVPTEFYKSNKGSSHH